VIVGGSDSFERLLKLTVREIESGRVRLGFQVDAAVPLPRWEVGERIQTRRSNAMPTDGPQP
jgi:sRNA-binding carbon storage regulator CsrA